jgi:predicted O-linked N-acetylglucosamine transferase (SPINDLY family)
MSDPGAQNPALDAAVKLHQAGKIDRAARAYRQILDADPDDPNALHLLGVTELQSGHYAEAVELIAQAIARQPNTGAYHLHHAAALRALRRIDDSIAEAEKAIVLDPNLAAQGYHIAAQAFADGGQPQEAYECWEKAIAARPGFVEAHLGVASMMDAMGNYFYATSQRQYAENDARRAVEREPDAAPARLLLGRALELAGKLDDAVAEYRAATRLLPHDAGVFHALGRALRRQGQTAEAATALRFALRMNPGLADAQAELAKLLLSQRRAAESADACRAALALLPDRPEFHAQLADALAAAGEIEPAADAARRGVELDPASPAARSTLLRTLLLDPRVTPQALVVEHAEWDRIHGGQMRRALENYTQWERAQRAAGESLPALPSTDKSPDRPLRIGFVSPHFRRGPLAKMLLPLLEHIDRGQFAVALYSDAAERDEVTAEFRKLASAWRNSGPLSDTQLALRVREDAIDVLVDLAGHGNANRMLAFAQQPAPVQVAQLGYPFTTGLRAIAYRLSDEIEHPSGGGGDGGGGEADALHSETLVRLPRPALCYRPWERAPARIERRKASEPITFAFAGEVAHLAPDAIETWAKVMSATPDARLLVMSSTRDVEATRARLTRHGIAPFRLAVLPPAEGTPYLDFFNQADVVLDTFPVSGGTTAGDALWMGRPMVTLAADSMPASRRAAVFLKSIGLHDLIATTPHQYVEIATSLARDRARLEHLAATLRDTLTRSPVMDAAGCAAAMTAFYRDAWRQWRASPASLP